MPLIFKEIFVYRYACCTGKNRSDHSETFAVNGQVTFPYLHHRKKKKSFTCSHSLFKENAKLPAATLTASPTLIFSFKKMRNVGEGR